MPVESVCEWVCIAFVPIRRFHMVDGMLTMMTVTLGGAVAFLVFGVIYLIEAIY